MESAPEQITYTLQDLVNIHQQANGTDEKLSKGWIVVNVPDTPQDSTQTVPQTNGVTVTTESTVTGSANGVAVTTCTQLPTENAVTTCTELQNAVTTCSPSENAVTTCTQLPSQNAVITCTQLPTENDTLGLQPNQNKDPSSAEDDDDDDDDDDVKPVRKPNEIKVDHKPRRRKKRLAIDAATEIDLKIMKNQLLDTSDIMSPPDLAPPTKKLMSWKKYGGADKLFVYPARTFSSQTAVDKTWTEPNTKTYPSLYPAL